MVEVTYNLITGRPGAVLSTLRRSLSAYLNSSYQRKVGITGDPERRALEYYEPYTEMIVRYQTSSERFVREVERILVYEYWYWCDNSIGGWGGSLSGPPYYLYIVR